MKYSVLLLPTVTVRIDDIEADSQADAIKQAVEYYDGIAHELHDRDITRGGSLAKVRYTEHYEQDIHIQALVDEDGDEEYNNSKWYVFSHMTGKAAVVTNQLERQLQDAVEDFVKEQEA